MASTLLVSLCGEGTPMCIDFDAGTFAHNHICDAYRTCHLRDMLLVGLEEKRSAIANCRVDVGDACVNAFSSTVLASFYK